MGGRLRGGEVLQRLREGVRSAPDGDVERGGGGGAVQGAEKGLGAGADTTTTTSTVPGGVVELQGLHAVDCWAGGDETVEGGGRRVLRRRGRRVAGEVVVDGGVGVDDLVDCLWVGGVGEPGGGYGDEAFGLEFVGVEEVADQGLGVVGFVEDVGEDEDARFGCFLADGGEDWCD